MARPERTASPAAPAISRRRIAMLIPGNRLEVNCESPIIDPFRAFDGDESELLQSHQLANKCSCRFPRIERSAKAPEVIPSYLSRLFVRKRVNRFGKIEDSME